MNLLRKPQNKWGWVRIGGLVALSFIVAWTILAALLRAVGDVSWLAWSGYRSFSLLDGFELAVLPIMAVFGTKWLEEQDIKYETEQASLRQVEQAVAANRKESLERLQRAVSSVLPDTSSGTIEISVQTRLEIKEIIQSLLPELDGLGKGEALRFFFEKEMLSGGKPVVDLKGIDCKGLKVQNAHFNGASLEGVDLSGAQLDRAHLVKACLTGANLSKSFFRHADLREAVLIGSNLSGARLEEANLEGADLSNANLEAAVFVNANLKNCKLAGFPASNADFNSIEMNDRRRSMQALEQAILVDTVSPEGRKVTNEKGKEFLQNKELAIVIDRL